MAAAVQILRSSAAAEKLLKPERLRMLELLAEPDSASGLARRLEMPRQTVNYHLRELEKEGLIEFVEHRPKGNCLERVMRATARSYLISPLALGSLGIDPHTAKDQFSSAYLASAAARTIQDLASLRDAAQKAGKTLATLTIETEIRFANAQTRKRFADELAASVAGLVEKYHDEKVEGGHRFRLLVGAHPVAPKQIEGDDSSVRME